MTTYYVRKTGLDANDGLSKGAAFLTIDKAANTVAASDQVFVGAGVYREQVVMDTAGTDATTNRISFTADVGGENTGDAGMVIISAYADELSATSRDSCVDPNEKDFITWTGFTMTGGGLGVVYKTGTGDVNYEGVIFEDCVFISGHLATDLSVLLDFNAATTPTGDGPTFRRCMFQGMGVTLRWNGNETADRDLKIVFESCWFGGSPDQGVASGIFFDLQSAGTFASGGVSVDNCTFYNKFMALFVDNGTSTTFPVAVTNSLFSHCRTALNKSTSNDGALTSSRNTFASVTSAYLNVSTGTGDRNNTTDPGLVGGIGDMPLYRFWGWSPYRPWSPIRVDDSVDAYTHSVIGDADTATAPAFDLFNENRPMWGTVDDRGAVEGRARPQQETTTVRTGTNAIRFEGAGFHDMLLPVGTSLTTVDVYAQHDGTYAGTLPQLKALDIPGVADQTDVQTGSSGSFEKLTVTFTATSDGVVRIRLVSSDTSAGGECFFDDLEIS